MAPALIAGGLCLGYGGYRSIQGLQFIDRPGPSKYDFGRTVNSLSVLIATHVAHKIEPNCTFKMTIEKPWFPDAEMHGKCSTREISGEVSLTLSGCSVKATGESGSMKGTVDKSEWDWNIKQSGPDRWEIERFLLKLDTTLNITVKDGKITGTYDRPLAFDWSLEGTYDKEGNVDISVSTPLLCPNFKITGKIIPTNHK